MGDAKLSWPRFKLRQLVVDYIGGGWGLEAAAEGSGEPAAVIRGTDIPGALIGNVTGIPRRFHKRSNLRSRKLQAGDIVFEVSGGSKDQPVGRALLCSESLLTKIEGDVIPASFCKRIVVNKAAVLPEFVYYFLKSIYDNRSISQWQVQSTGISNFQFEAFLDECELALPPLDVQEDIAGVLSAYDKLIENNTRRTSILEEIARRTYEEWFVHFRFPGHEQVRMVDAEQGLIPEGWRTARIGELSSYINRGIAPKYDDEAEGLVVNQKCIRDQRLSYVLARRQSKPIPDEKRIRLGDVLINSTGVGTLGRVAQVLEELPHCTADSHVTIVRPNEEATLHFFGMALLAKESYFEQQGVGSTGQTELSRSRVAETDAILPPRQLQQQFEAVVGPLRQLAIVLSKKNIALRSARDLLLPKLISGETALSTMAEPEELIPA